MWDIEHSLVNYLLKIIPIVKMTLYHTDILNFRLFTRFSIFSLCCSTFMLTIFVTPWWLHFCWGHYFEEGILLNIWTPVLQVGLSVHEKYHYEGYHCMKDITVWKISLYERYPSIKCEGSMYLVWDLVGQFRQNMDIVRVEHSLDHIHRFMLAVHQILVI